MSLKYFITGTDTGVGKTKITEAILRRANELNLSTLGLKPVAAGADFIEGAWSNDDARAIIESSSVKLDYASVNPVLLRAAMAPHLAAEREDRRLSVQSLVGFCRGALMLNKADVTLLEGAGGWRVPLNSRETMADMVQALKLDVIVVVGMKLGCLNHALLTVEAIERDGLRIAGWVANCIDPKMDGLDENIQTLHHLIKAPLLGVMPYLAEGELPTENWLSADFLSKASNNR